MKDQETGLFPPGIAEDQMNGPTFDNAQEFVHSLFGSKTNLQVRTFVVKPISRGFRIEIEVRRKKPRKVQPKKIP